MNLVKLGGKRPSRLRREEGIRRHKKEQGGEAVLMEKNQRSTTTTKGSGRERKQKPFGEGTSSSANVQLERMILHSHGRDLRVSLCLNS